jgi:O-antigen/teichoic acid export membrane protein
LKLNNPLIKNFLSYVVTDGLAKAMPFLVMPILALYMNTEEFGIASNFLVFTQLLGAIIGLSTYSYLTVEYYKTETSERKSLIGNLVLLNFVIFCICALVTPFISSYFESWFYIILQWQLLGCLMMFFTAITELFVAYLRLEEKTKQYRNYQLLRSFLSAVLSLIFVVILGLSWQGRILGLIVTSFIVFIFAIIVFKKANLLTFKFDKKIIKDSVLFGIPLLPHKLASWVVKGFERILITSKVSISETGVFAFGSNFTSALTIVISSFFGAFSPYVYKKLSADLVSDKEIQLQKFRILKITYLSIIGFAIVLVLAYIALFGVIKLLFNEDYQKALEYIPFFLVASFFGFLYNHFSLFIFYSKKVKWMGLITISVGIFQALIMFPLINEFQGMGAAYAAIIGALLKSTLVGIYSNKVYPMPWLDFKNIIK